jgi:hypothetical protein
MKRIIIVFASFVLIYTITCLRYSYGNDTDGGFETRLPKKLYRALTAEMNALQNGMSNLSIAIPAGRLKETAGIARKMKEGYIMNDVLTSEQIKQLNTLLPSGYAAMDREFKKVTEKLLWSANEKERKNVTLFFYQLTEQCVQCHAKYAQKRFPDFRE